MSDEQPTPDETGVAIETLTVEVRTVTVNKHTMSLSMYRQLIEEPLDEKAHLWGTVNYHEGDKCYDRFGPGAHYHVVWQAGAELRRSTVYLAHLVYDMGTESAAVLWGRIRELPQLFIG